MHIQKIQKQTCLPMKVHPFWDIPWPQPWFPQQIPRLPAQLHVLLGVVGLFSPGRFKRLNIWIHMVRFITGKWDITGISLVLSLVYMDLYGRVLKISLG